MIVYSAPAKVIISGEHAVVYGKPALATAVDMRIFVALWKHDEHAHEYSVQHTVQKKLTSHIPLQDLTQLVPKEDVERVISIVKSYLEKKSIPIHNSDPFEFALFSQIPLGRGLGSSASLSVAVVAALLDWYTGKKPQAEVVNSLAYKVEKHFHHNPSGIDNSVACYGGLVYYRKEFEFLKQFSALHFKLSSLLESHLFLIDTGKPVETTADMVQAVGKKYNATPRKMEMVFHAIEKVTKRIVISVAQENNSLFCESLKENNRYLDEIGVISSFTRSLIEKLRQYGSAKVTGAGGKKKGSGFLLFYTPNPEELTSFLYEQKISYYKFKQDLEGVRREKTE